MLRFSHYHTQIYNELNKEGKNYNNLVVIGAGQIRTGSLSMKAALTHLLQAKCFHNTDVLASDDQEDVDVCLAAVEGRIKPEDWRKYLLSKNYAAALDFPVNMFYKDVTKAFPSAKVILTTRDPATWYQSVIKLFDLHGYQQKNPRIWNAVVAALDGRSGTNKLFMNQTEDNVWRFVPEGCGMSLEDAVRGGPDTAEKFFVDWEKEVVRSVPEDKLLVFRAEQGWEPLCRFLGVEQPDVPYPWLHRGSTLEDVKANFRITIKQVVYGIPVFVAAVTGWMAATFI